MNIYNFFTALSKSKLFSNFDAAQITNLFKELNYRLNNYVKDEAIHMENEVCKSLSIIISGIVEIQKIDSSGKVLTIAQFHEADTFGENLIFGNKSNYPVTVISKTDTIILDIDKNSVIKLCQTNTDFLNEYLKIVSNKAIVLSSKLNEVTLKSIRQMICDFLLHEYNNQKNKKIKLNMTKNQWADKMGVQRPSLSRELIKMKEDGIIDYDRNTIEIKDLDLLEELA